MRALAVGLVVLNHAGVPWLSGGYIGVDVFFVISGFLITQLLIDEADKGSSIDLRNFWARRARRILPMSILVTLVTVVAGLFMLEPGKVRDLSAVGLGALGFCFPNIGLSVGCNSTVFAATFLVACG
jgi:peptidoglycan/LPS O-acetylase OafA/YrhL